MMRFPEERAWLYPRPRSKFYHIRGPDQWEGKLEESFKRAPPAPVLNPSPPLWCVEFEEAAELLSADPGASTLSMSASPPPAAGEEVKLDLSEDEEVEEESSEVRNVRDDADGVLRFSS